VLEVRRGDWLKRFFPVDKKIGHCLGLDRTVWLVVNVVDAELNCPLGLSTGRITIEDDVGERGQGDDLDRVLMEIRGQSSLGPEHEVN
jgi:hypothetical protein